MGSCASGSRGRDSPDAPDAGSRSRETRQLAPPILAVNSLMAVCSRLMADPRTMATAEEDARPSAVVGPHAVDVWTGVEVAFKWLASIEEQRWAVIEQLRAWGAVRSSDVVGDLGEWMAGLYYGVDLKPPSTPAYDLVAGDMLVQVKTLRSDRYRRGSMGRLQTGFTHLLAIRLDRSFRPVIVYEIPRAVVEQHASSTGRLELTKALESDPGVVRIPGDEFAAVVKRRLATRV